jgi:hypothetical protein
MVKNIEVHTTHCCKRHGCKYNDPLCPVEFSNFEGIICEDCRSEEAEFNEQILPSAKIAFERTWIYLINIDGPNDDQLAVYVDRLRQEFLGRS